jgi:hypothetical protein
MAVFYTRLSRLSNRSPGNGILFHRFSLKLQQPCERAIAIGLSQARSEGDKVPKKAKQGKS